MLKEILQGLTLFVMIVPLVIGLINIYLGHYVFRGKKTFDSVGKFYYWLGSLLGWFNELHSFDTLVGNGRYGGRNKYLKTFKYDSEGDICGGYHIFMYIFTSMATFIISFVIIHIEMFNAWFEALVVLVIIIMLLMPRYLVDLIAYFQWDSKERQSKRIAKIEKELKELKSK